MDSTMNSDRVGPFRVGLIFPMSGPFGLVGPSSELSAQLARDELNAADGVLGRSVELIAIDGGRDPAAVAGEVSTLVDAGALDAVAGMHTSAVRRAVIPVTVKKRQPTNSSRPWISWSTSSDEGAGRSSATTTSGPARAPLSQPHAYVNWARPWCMRTFGRSEARTSPVPSPHSSDPGPMVPWCCYSAMTPYISINNLQLQVSMFGAFGSVR